jgi:2-polyprenyl-6-methoxyphenol hydroxylase-like FAD-dependent oxidoreductase
MEKIVIIGGGIIGMTLANYLDTTKYQVTVVDDLQVKRPKRVPGSFLLGFPNDETSAGIS